MVVGRMIAGIQPMTNQEKAVLKAATANARDAVQKDYHRSRHMGDISVGSQPDPHQGRG